MISIDDIYNPIKIIPWKRYLELGQLRYFSGGTIALGDHIIKSRVVEWDPLARDFMIQLQEYN